ncbi:MAG TPA: TIGR02186 family protein [Terriglobia bacterium]|jgi:hypothetical protein|nr:TIGR02186 family protein [Terriglobia bacterium]
MARRDAQATLTALLVLMGSWLGFPSALAQESRPRVIPETVRMGAFYGGAAVRVEGVSRSGENVIILVRGAKVKEVFNKVGRVGPIWVTTGKVTISDVPSLLLVFSPEPVGTCLTRAAIDKYGLDLPALKKQMHVESKTGDYDRIADDYFVYKIKRGTYQMDNRGIQQGQPDKNGTPYRLDFTLPKSAGPGQYEIKVLECRSHEVVRNSDLSFKVVEVGFPALIAWLAMEHSSAYGIIAVAVAMIAGFGIDFIAARLFKRKVVGH